MRLLKSSHFLQFIGLWIIFSIFYYRLYAYDTNFFICHDKIIETKVNAEIASNEKDIISYRIIEKENADRNAALLSLLKTGKYILIAGGGLQRIDQPNPTSYVLGGYPKSWGSTFDLLNEKEIRGSTFDLLNLNEKEMMFTIIDKKISPKDQSETLVTTTINATDYAKQLTSVPEDFHLKDDYSAEIKKIEQRNEQLKKAKAKVLGFFDFLYFSMVTQGTLGYGDITPNSTIVRILVIFQLCIAVFIIADTGSSNFTKLKKDINLILRQNSEILARL